MIYFGRFNTIWFHLELALGPSLGTFKYCMNSFTPYQVFPPFAHLPQFHYVYRHLYVLSYRLHTYKCGIHVDLYSLATLRGTRAGFNFMYFLPWKVSPLSNNEWLGYEKYRCLLRHQQQTLLFWA